MTPDWIRQVKATKPIIDVASSLGLQTMDARGSETDSFQCPCCSKTTRHTKAYRSPLACKVWPGGRWSCFANGCDASGDVVDLAAFSRHGRRYGDLDTDRRREVREFFGVVTTAPTRAAPRTRTTSNTPSNSDTKCDESLSEERAPPPQAELIALARQFRRVDSDAEVAAFLRSRGLEPTAIADAGLAYALPATARTPDWASIGSVSWSRAGYRAVVTMYDAGGIGRSMIARSVRPNPRIKSLPPRGYSRRGLVMADSLGRQMLRHGTHPSTWPEPVVDGVPFSARANWWPADVPMSIVIVEGEIDFLSAALEWTDAAEHAPATLGIVGGSWTPAVAARIPEGSNVLIAVDHDQTGDKYAQKIIDTLRGRSLNVRRSRAAVAGAA